MSSNNDVALVLGPRPKGMPLGVWLNNPGNLKVPPSGPQDWTGLGGVYTDANGVQWYWFRKPRFGIRAILRTLQTYQSKRKAADGTAIDTVQEVIERWAPLCDNNEPADYAAFVRHKAGLQRGQPIDCTDYEHAVPICLGIIEYENGVQPYDDKVLRPAATLAGLEIPPKELKKSRTMRGGVAAIGLTAAGTQPELLDKAMGFLPYLDKLKEHSLLIIGVAAALAVAYMMWARYRDRQDGVS